MGRAAQVLVEPRCKGSPVGAVACIQQRLESLQEAINTHSAREAHLHRVGMANNPLPACPNGTQSPQEIGDGSSFPSEVQQPRIEPR